MSLWSKLFGKDPKDLFLSFTPEESHWRVVSWNFDLNSPEDRQWVIEVHGPEILSIEWYRRRHEQVKFFQDGRLIRIRNVRETHPEFKALMNLAIHSTLKFSLEENHEFMVTPVSGATTMDFQNEQRALQWIQASFGTLTRALDRMAEDSSLILTAGFFAGTEKETGERVLRLVAMNLDIFFYLREDQSLHIVVFDDKDMGHGASKTPTFQQIIKVTKPQFYDEIVKLVHRLAIVGEVR